MISVEDLDNGQRQLEPQRARTYCEELERGEILFFHQSPFDLPAGDRSFLISQRTSSSRVHKNISYRPSSDELRGFTGSERQQVHGIMRHYSAQVIQFVANFLSPYAGRFILDYASFRPLEEEGRQLPLHKRNDLLHVDAFPSRPTHGGRILRVFTNISSDKPRVWITTDEFRSLAGRYARGAGLEQYARSAWRRRLSAFGRVLPITALKRSPYDSFMLRFHDYLKENAEEGTVGIPAHVHLAGLYGWMSPRGPFWTVRAGADFHHSV